MSFIPNSGKVFPKIHKGCVVKKSLVISFSILLSGLVLAMNLDAQPETGKSVIRVKCPDSMVARIYSLSKIFMENFPETEVDVWKGLSVEGGIRALIQGDTDVAMSTRRITDQEIKEAVRRGKGFVERLIGYGGIVILTTRSNHLDSITVERLRKIFKGEYTRWDQIGGSNEPITVFSVGAKHPGTVIFMEQDFLGDASITDKAIVVEDFPTIMRKVAATPGSIGFVRIRDAFESPIAREQEIKVLAIQQNDASAAVMPSRAYVGDGTYPIRRPYYLYYEKGAGPAIRNYADFIVEKGWGPQNL